jgi:Bacterial RNA polymerase, alpha chain C terminal domain
VKDPHATIHQHRMRIGTGCSDLGDLFAVNPIRRSLTTILVSLAIMLLPAMFLHGGTQAAVMVLAIWFGCTGLILCVPILIWSVLEALWARIQRRLWPTIDQLDLTPRAHNLLRRHGFVTIVSVEQTPDTTMLLLSNMDPRALHEIRRSVSLWRYRRWQERGFR